MDGPFRFKPEGDDNLKEIPQNEMNKIRKRIQKIYNELNDKESQDFDDDNEYDNDLKSAPIHEETEGSANLNIELPDLNFIDKFDDEEEDTNSNEKRKCTEYFNDYCINSYGPSSTVNKSIVSKSSKLPFKSGKKNYYVYKKINKNN